MKWNKNLELCKDPADVLDYKLDYTQLLQSDSIASITVVGEKLTIDSSSFSGNVVTIFVSGGTNGNTGIVKTTIVTTNTTPRTFERSFRIKLEDK